MGSGNILDIHGRADFKAWGYPENTRIPAPLIPSIATR
jgi:hypothetical protein